MKAQVLLRCSFCGKGPNDVRKLIAGPEVYICDECVEICNDIIYEEWLAEVREQGGEVQARDGLSEPTTGGPLEVRHTPLSRKDVPREFIDRLRQAHYGYVRFYRTAVTNNTDRPIRIVWFDAFLSSEGDWMASNIRNKVLRTRDFTDWYGGDSIVPDGWLQPGATASDQVNWHFTETPMRSPPSGPIWRLMLRANDYFAEAIVPAIRAERLTRAAPTRARAGERRVRPDTPEAAPAS